MANGVVLKPLFAGPKRGHQLDVQYCLERAILSGCVIYYRFVPKLLDENKSFSKGEVDERADGDRD